MRPDRHRLALTARLAEASYPYEACGVWPSDGDVLALPNRLHGQPAGRVRFELDEAALLSVLTRGAELTAIFHSHCDAGAALSDEDRQRLAPLGQPLYPGVLQLVVSVEAGRARRISGYAFFGGTWVTDFSVQDAEWLHPG